jgi:hypothetical protein
MGVDMRLLQLNLKTLQRRELLEPAQLALRNWREDFYRRLFEGQQKRQRQRQRQQQRQQQLQRRGQRRGQGQNQNQNRGQDRRRSGELVRELGRELGRDLRLRVVDRGVFGQLLEPLLGYPNQSGGASAAGSELLQHFPRRSRGSRLLIQRLARTLGLKKRFRGRFRGQFRGRLRRSGSGQPRLLLPRPLRKGRRRLGFDDFLTETLGLAGSGLGSGSLGRARKARQKLLQRPVHREPLSFRRSSQLELLGSGNHRTGETAAEETDSRRRSWERQAQSLDLGQTVYGRGYRPAERLRCGGALRRPGGQQVALRGRRENLLSGYLAVETDLHPFRGWPVDYHREQCWDFWKLDQSLVPAATLQRLSLTLEDLPELLRRYLVGRQDYYTNDQLSERSTLRSERDLLDFEKRVVAELKKLCPSADHQDRLEA